MIIKFEIHSIVGVEGKKKVIIFDITLLSSYNCVFFCTESLGKTRILYYNNYLKFNC